MSQVFTYRCSHCKAKVCIDVDFANCHLSCFAKHFFRYALCTRNVATKFVTFCYEFRQYGGCPMQYDWEVRQ